MADHMVIDEGKSDTSCRTTKTHPVLVGSNGQRQQNGNGIHPSLSELTRFVTFYRSTQQQDDGR